jgi:H/ACA ribonucleoprotein complex subunit 4
MVDEIKQQFTIYEKVPNYFTNEKYGKSPQERSIKELLELGIINLDKPANPTSHEVTAWVKQLLGIQKAGHGGTLDPAVTGCLPIALGRATRSLRVLLLSGKEYVCVMKTHAPIKKDQLESVLENFKGKIYQTPPVRSNVKRRLRVRKIYELELLEYSSPQLSLLRIACEAGTYIRKLCHDIGLLLGTGAHMLELRRTRTGPFNEKLSYTLQDLRDAWYYYTKEGDESFIREIIQPIEVIYQNLPVIYIRDSAVDAICHGAALTIPGVLQITSELSSQEILERTNGICARSMTVFMKKETYPAVWQLS